MYDFNGKIAAMVSGGVDSMVMLDILLKKHADVVVVHVNHSIREEAESDCAFVRNYCEKINVPFVRYDFDIPSLCQSSGRSIETEARLARRSVVQKLLYGGKADKVALAHHADDNAETVLMHILRGSGIEGLAGIRQTDKIIRPVLHMTKEQILEYARLNDIPYVTDATNFDSSYTRNFIRLEVMPLIKKRYPSAVRTLNRLAQNMIDTLDALDSQLDLGLISEEDGAVKLDIEALNSPLAFRYIMLAAKKLMPIDITRAQILGVMELNDLDTGSKAELAGGLKAYKEYGCITFCFDREKSDISVPFAEGRIEFGDSVITVERVKPTPVKGKTIVASVPSGSIFRYRREGDRFTPYGGKEKSLKKYLIDKKVPRRLRDSLVCLCLGSEVLAVVGLEISDKVKIAGDKEAFLICVNKREQQ